MAVVQQYRPGIVVCDPRCKCGQKPCELQDWEAQINEQEGKEHLGLVCKLVREGKMPPADYRTIHTGTNITPAETEAICAWSQKVGTVEDDDKKDDKKDDK